MSKKKILEKIRKFPNSPGVYIFQNEKQEILYVGKATSLHQRVGSYFANGEKLILKTIRPIETMIAEVADVKIKKTDTVLEAYILEQAWIKKFQPKYNMDGKDDKSFSFVAFTQEDFPRVVLARKKELEKNSKLIGAKNLNLKKGALYGPYTSKKNIETVLKILRKIFPYHDRKENSETKCLDFQIGLCPGPYAGQISRAEYKKNIQGIKMILAGKKKKLLTDFKKEMDEFSKKQEFEMAAQIRNRIFALRHIQDVALISREGEEIWQKKSGKKILRIEGYDISNISGAHSVGAMVVFDNENGNWEAKKSQYRKFKIKTIQGANDVGAMKEIIWRRFKNNWQKPDLILLDGGAGHLSAVRQVLSSWRLEIPILAVAKGPDRKKMDLRSFGTVPPVPLEALEKIRNEAHRFAISYHRKLRAQAFAKR